MDLQCPAVVVCLAPQERVPTAAGGHRVAAVYAYGSVQVEGEDPERVPEGPFWQAITKIADLHRGEAAVLYARAEELEPRDLLGVALSVDSAGPVRIPIDQPVDNGY